jgi:RND family efflux transporter MFP subunit
MKKYLVLAALPALVGFSGCHQPTPSAPSEQAVAVQTVAVSSQTGSATVSIAGVVKPHLEADLSAQIIAPVAVVTKREGDHFRRGDVLVRLHAPALDAGVAQAQAALASARQQESASTTQARLASDTLGRYAQLRERHSVTPYELDQMKTQNASAQAQQQSAAAQVTAAQATVTAQRANASDAVLYAPFDGVVTRRMVDPGAMAAPGVPLLHLQSTGEREVEFSVPDAFLEALRVGSTIAVAMDGASSTQAKITNISPAGDAGSHSFLVKAELPSASDWSVGAVVQVMLPSARSANGLFVPSQSIVHQGGLDAVLVVTPDARAEVRYVTLGREHNEEMEILTGLHAGERVIQHGDLSLAGRKIEVR